jgi:hypothetical protein
MNENVESFVTLGPKALAKVEAVHAISRLNEIEQLASNGKLDAQTRKEAEKQFDVQTQETIKNIDELKSKGKVSDALQVNSDFQKSLSEHESTLTGIINHDSTKSETKAELTNIVSNIHNKIKKTGMIENDIEDNKNSSTTENNLSSTTRKTIEKSEDKNKTEEIDSKSGKVEDNRNKEIEDTSNSEDD